MKNNKFKKNVFFKIIIIFLIPLVFLFTAGFTKFPEAKNETVYVNLNTDGTVRKVITVNWLSVSGLSDNEEADYIDYGEYSELKSMINGYEPIADENKIIWGANAFESGNLFYQGATEKEIPLNIKIRYFLDGREIAGKDIAGKSGNLKIEINIKNKLKQKENVAYSDYYGNKKAIGEERYTPLMVQLSIKADVTRFSDIRAEGATKVLSGKIMNISFADFPFPESDFTVDMYGEDIRLEPISIIAIPSEIPIAADFDENKENLQEFDSGLIEMSDGSEDIIEGSGKLHNGLSELKKGSSDLVSAISEINHGLYVLSGSNNDINRGFEEINNGLNEFNEKGGDMINAAQQLTSNLESIVSGLDQSAGGASNLSQGLDSLTNATRC